MIIALTILQFGIRILLQGREESTFRLLQLSEESLYFFFQDWHGNSCNLPAASKFGPTAYTTLRPGSVLMNGCPE
jgi:hypothetical protein